jgi:hypothetical protein
MTLVLRRTVAASAVALAALVAPAVVGVSASAAETPLAVRLVGAQPGTALAPGATQRLTVELINRTAKPRQVRTFVTPVGTPAKQASATSSGSTGWIRYAKAVVTLRAKGSTKRTLAVAVPAETRAGEYAAVVVVEDAAPAAGVRAVRVTTPVVVRVKGALKGAAELGPVTHQLVGGKSLLSFDVRNTGNRVLRPKVLLALKNAAGKPAGSAQIELKPVYAGTTSTPKVPLAVALPAGAYSVTATLSDPAARTSAKRVTAGLRVGSAAPAAKRAKPAVSAAADEAGGVSPLLLGGGAVVVAGLLVALVLRRRGGAGLGLHRARRSSPDEPRPAAPDGAEPLLQPVVTGEPGGYRDASGEPGGPRTPDAAPVHLPSVFAELAAHTPPPPPPAPAADLPTPALVSSYTVRDILPGG